ncbi:calcium-binding protein [Streptomyces sp. NBC_01433]|uniref:calcium-binding protein n=1 Tax=Streptomyces sp. NBC_01433 TaxID=2903864 RepID=UPI00224DAC6E|nr:calcium-binding protein [Streptomyces sp. NBC_01433]MCX4675211.1 calcium-binding protein [Streptomyces sp. NBC_01433]
MRIRATVAVATGALALSALTIPAAQAAQADDGRSWSLDYKFPAPKGSDTAKAPLGARAAAADTFKVTKIVTNAGKPIVVGTTAKKKISISVTATDTAGVGGVAAYIWVGKNRTDEDSFGFGPEEDGVTCKAVNATTTTCKTVLTVEPGWLMNSDARNWHVGIAGVDDNGEEYAHDSLAWVKMQRLSKLTANASPEPVKKGKTITVTGKLTRANWETGTYKGYSKQSVKLQFRKKNSKTYTTIKTIKSSSTGALKTTVKATVDGYWRYSFGGTSSTPAVSAGADYLDVK